MRNLKILMIIMMAAVCTAAASAKDDNLQKAELDFINPVTEEPLKLTIWYPAGKGDACRNAAICLADSVKKHQAIVLSHGAMGSAREMNWIGYAMASQGFVAVGVNHYGESWAYGQETIEPRRVLEMWRRPAAISVALDLLALNESPDGGALFSETIDWTNMTAIGFSSGGSSVLALAGAKYDPALAISYCASDKSAGDLSCKYLPKGENAKLPQPHTDTEMKDARIRRVVALDPAAGHLTAKASLEEISVPTLIVAAKQNDFLSFDRHASFYAGRIKGVQLVTLDEGEGHFVFLDTCDHQYKAHGIPLCQDRDGVDRKSVHRAIYPALFSFLYRNP